MAQRSLTSEQAIAIGEAVKTIREERGLTQENVVDILGRHTQNYIHRLEGGYAPVGAKTAVGIVLALADTPERKRRVELFLIEKGLIDRPLS